MATPVLVSRETPTPAIFLELEELIRQDNPNLSPDEVYATAQRMIGRPGEPGACVHRMPEGLSSFKNGRCVRCGFPDMAEPSTAAPDLGSSIIELIYAGNVLAKLAGKPTGSFTDCVCGLSSDDPTNPASHSRTCPVGRYYAAVEVVKQAVR